MAKKRLYLKIILVTLYIFGIALVSAICITYASGYRYDFQEHRLYKVSVAKLVADPSADITVNNQELKIKTPKAFYLEPGDYQVALKKDGYQTALINLSLGQGQLYEDKFISLFKDNINPEIKTRSVTNYSDYIDDSLTGQTKNLYVYYDHEIWSNSTLVTRLSEDIKSVAYYNNYYIIYQTNSYIGVIRTSGQYNTVLFSVPETNPLNFEFKNHGKTLIASNSEIEILAEIK